MPGLQLLPPPTSFKYQLIPEKIKTFFEKLFFLLNFCSEASYWQRENERTIHYGI